MLLIGRRKEGRKCFIERRTQHIFFTVKWCHDHSDSEKANLLSQHRLLFPISSKGSFICTIPDRIADTTAFVTPVVEHWLEQEILEEGVDQCSSTSQPTSIAGEEEII